MRELMPAFRASGIGAMECYYSTAWDKEMMLDAMLEQPGWNSSRSTARTGDDFDPSSPDSEVRQNAVEAFADAIDVARRLGAKVLVAHPGSDYECPAPRDARIGFAADTLGRVADIAGENGVVSAIEPLPKQEIGNSLDDVCASSS